MNKNLLNTSKTSKISKMIKRLILLLLVMVTPIVVFAEQTSDYSDTIEETVDVGKGLNIMPNLEGSELEVVELEKEDEEEVMMPRMRMAIAPASVTSDPKFGSFTGQGGSTIYIYTKSTGTDKYTYIAPTTSSSGVVPILDEADGRYKIAISGIIGWINKISLKLYSFDEAKGFDRYKVEGNELFHYIATSGATSTSHSVIVQGEAPSYLKTKTDYISYDGHYFYPGTKSGLSTMISDYNAGHRNNSLNKNDPYYNYFQWLPTRSQTKLTAKDFANYMKNNIKYDSAYDSKLYELEQLFVDNGNLYGSNAAMGFATGIHESGFGRSHFAKSKNNFFGHNAYDSDPGLSTAYTSVNSGIRNHFAWFINWLYSDSNSTTTEWRYRGSFLGNKNIGINVEYASDPYWGEKIAAHYYKMDKLAGSKDYKLYTLATVNASGQKVYASASTSSISPYYIRYTGIPVAITGESGNFYRHTSESHLNSNKTIMDWAASKDKYAKFNIANNQLYIAKSGVTIVSEGKEANVYAQQSVVEKSSPTFTSGEKTYYTVNKSNHTKLYPDWSASNYKAILTIPKNTKLTGMDTNNNMVLVTYDSPNGTFIGYVNKADLTTTKPSSNATTTDLKYETTDSINLRMGPSTQYSVIKTIPKGMVIEGDKSIGDWARVIYYENGKTAFEGYVHKDYIKETTKPVNKPKPEEETPKPEEPKPTPENKLGDLNGDGKLDVIDAAMLQAHLREIKKLGSTAAKAADINGDGKIDVIDAAMMQAHLREIKKIKGW